MALLEFDSRDAMSGMPVAKLTRGQESGEMTGMGQIRMPPSKDDQLEALNRIGMDLMLEHDLPVLLTRILSTAKALTSSDGGALFLADHEAQPPELVLHLYEFDSIDRAEVADLRAPIDDTSIAGHAARIKKPVVIRDAYDLPPDAEYMLDRTFDQRHRYRRRSMAFVPLVDQRAHLVGLFVLVNRKSDPRARLTDVDAVDRYVVPYSQRDVDVARSLAGQAAVAIENAQLHARIERMMETVIEVAVTAIDERDPATAGHSLRVAKLSLDLARAVDAVSDGPYRDVHFSGRQLRELRFVGLLHDVGKLVVPENVLLKAKKLPPVLYERVMARFDLIRQTLELKHCSSESSHGADLAAELAELDQMRRTVCSANEPTIADRDPSDELAAIAARRFRGPHGDEINYLTDEELHFLRLRRGTLDEDERALAEYHAEATHRLLSSVLWTDDLKNVPAYAYAHHEMLDGSGYPRHLRAPEISLQTRIVELCDMFDALTQADRPYKHSLSREETFKILEGEVGVGRLDGELLRILQQSLKAA
jgi:HD-GYP domain-containing protein (c-di-GMP phosphodiesterase class II)